VDQGLNLQQYVRECIARMRDLLLIKLGMDDRVLAGAAEKTALAARAERFSEQDLIRYFDLLLRLENDLRFTSQPRFQGEVGLLKLARIGHVRDIEEGIRDLRQDSPAGSRPTSSPAKPPVTPKPLGFERAPERARSEPTPPPKAPVPGKPP